MLHYIVFNAEEVSSVRLNRMAQMIRVLKELTIKPFVRMRSNAMINLGHDDTLKEAWH